MLLTAEGANVSMAWLQCRYHPESGSSVAASMLEQTAEPLVRRAAGTALWATESRLLKGKHGASDFVLDLRPGPAKQPEARHLAAIEVDGTQHFERPRSDRSQLERRRIDREKDEAAWQQRRPVVRLHHADIHQWTGVLAAAKHYGKQQGLLTFILYTESYNLPSQGLWADGTETEIKWHEVGGWVGAAGWWRQLTFHCLARFQPLESEIQ